MTASDAPLLPVRISPLNLAALAVVVVVFAMKVWVALAVGLDGDEAYYAMWSAYLSPGYLDHPPGVALIIAAGRAIAGYSLLGVRVVPLLVSLMITAALYRTARILFASPSAPAVAVIWYTLSLAAGANFASTPDVPSTLFWMLGLWAAAEAMYRGRPNWWLAVGLFAGAGLVGKYTNVWLGVGLLLFLVSTPEGRRQLTCWQLWAGGALALVVFSPVVWWNATHAWASFLFQGARVVTFREAEYWGKPMVEFLASQVLLIGPVTLLYSVLGAAAYLFGRERKALALPVLTTLPLLAYFAFHALHSRVEANWTQPLLPGMALVAAWFVTWRTDWWRQAAVWLQSALGVTMLGLVYVQSLFQPFELGLLDRARGLRGWSELSSDVRQLAEDNGAKAIWTMGNYRLTGELFFWGKSAGDSRPVRDAASHPRYDFIPDEERVPNMSPALLVELLPGPAAPPHRSDFAVQHSLGLLTRQASRDQVEYYAVSLVEGGLPEAPSAANAMVMKAN